MRYKKATSAKILERRLAAEKFYTTVLDPEEKPCLVTDQATLYDIYIGDENELIWKIKKKYGVVIKLNDFNEPFWKVLDILERK